MFADLRNFNENITGKPADWVTPEWKSGASRSSLALAIILGVFTFVDVLGETGSSGAGFARIILYTVLVALAALFATWVISTVLLQATFKKNPTTAILSIISSLLILSIVKKFGGFILIEANWDVVWANRVNLAIGPFFTSGVTQPHIANETWRLWPTIYLVAILIGATYGTIKERAGKFLIPFSLFSLICLFAIWNPNHINYNPGATLLLFGGALACAYISFGAVYYYSLTAEEYLVNRINSWVAIASVLTFVLTMVLLDPPDRLVEAGLIDFNLFGHHFVAEEGVAPLEWGGLFINLIFSVAACVIGSGIAVLLAFGRRSELPFFKWPSVGIIEIVRSGPLVAWLFIAFFLVPDIIRPIYEADSVMRTIIIISLFGGCYMAEVLRGGLQAVPHGQIEAAIALGLSPMQTKLYVELPSAIRTTLPAIVSIFIGLWKDTTLVYLVGVLDFFNVAKVLASTDKEFLGDYREPLFFAGFIFWVFAFYMSRISRRIEAKLGLVKEGGGEAT
jgi:general L-amino acid transport system permease protein